MYRFNSRNKQKEMVLQLHAEHKSVNFNVLNPHFYTCAHIFPVFESLHLPPRKPVEVRLFVSGGFLITTSEEAGRKSPWRVETH